MRAIVLRRFGGPDVLAVAETAVPDPSDDEALVRVHYAGVNRADLLQRAGRYPAPPDSPQDVPGLEVAGVVEAVGPRVSRFGPGDRVLSIVGGGGYAEYVAVPESVLVAVPEGMSLREAGAVPEVFMTAFDAVWLQAGLEAGETLLVHACGSGVGTAAIQLAKAWDVATIGTSRTPAKLERASELGMDHGVLVDPDRDWAADVLALTDGRGVDVILDLVGATYLSGNGKVLGLRGRHVVVGVPSGPRAEIDLRVLMGKRASLIGTVLRARATAEKASLARAFERDVIPLFTRGQVVPVIDRVVSAEQAAEAHRLLESNQTFGKVLLDWT
jgi:NADPH2:quinone reductase